MYNFSYSFLDPVSKFLITTGWNGDAVTKSELMDLSELGNYQCPDWIDYPIPVASAIGGLLGTRAIICSGGGDECYVISRKKAELFQRYTSILL